LAARLASTWRQGALREHVGCDELQQAILHHDDGWEPWDRAPRVDPQSGRPYDFLEMPLPEALRIWERSIERARQIGPLAAYVVSGHFTALLGASLSRRAEAERQPEAASFLARQALCQRLWLAAWHAAGPARTEAAAGAAVAALQFFDRLSLWFCCRELPPPREDGLPGGARSRFEAVAVGRVRVEPWPWDAPSLEVFVTARRVEAAHYASDAELAKAASQVLTLGWLLRP
jgi:hypothetical protein